MQRMYEDQSRKHKNAGMSKRLSAGAAATGWTPRQPCVTHIMNGVPRQQDGQGKKYHGPDGGKGVPMFAVMCSVSSEVK